MALRKIGDYGIPEQSEVHATCFMQKHGSCKNRRLCACSCHGGRVDIVDRAQRRREQA